MALIRCPECGREVSNQAPACIHCGYPLQGSMEPPVWEEKPEAGEVVIRMPKYEWYGNADVVVNFTLDDRFIANLRPSETISAPVERNCELVARCRSAEVSYPIKAGKRTVIDLTIGGFGVLKLLEEGADPSMMRKSHDPGMIVLIMIGIGLLVVMLTTWALR